jgi:3-isopropylmalate/(R)-2-methylmalate dehydratase large subunit
MTLYDKIFEEHVVSRLKGMCVLYIDRHLVEDHASPQAFDGLRKRGLKVRAPEKTLAVVDHNVPTTKRCLGIENKASRIQIETLARNTKEFASSLFSVGDVTGAA